MKNFPVSTRISFITPYLTVKGGDAAIEFYKKAFEAEERGHMKTPDAKTAHAELKIGDSIFMLSDEFPEMTNLSPHFRLVEALCQCICNHYAFRLQAKSS